MMYADSNYSFNPWMRDVLPQMQPDNDAIELLAQEEMVEALITQSPPPVPAGYTPRLGYESHEPTIDDVLNIGATSMLRTSDMGQQGSLRNVLGNDTV